jgi:hypothetical protein
MSRGSEPEAPEIVLPATGEPYSDAGVKWRPHPDRVGIKRATQ